MEPIIQNAGALTLPLRGISVIAVQAPNEWKTKHIYQPNTSYDLPSSNIFLAVYLRSYHNYPKVLIIHLLNTEYGTVHVPGKTC